MARCTPGVTDITDTYETTIYMTSHAEPCRVMPIEPLSDQSRNQHESNPRLSYQLDVKRRAANSSIVTLGHSMIDLSIII